MGVIRDAGKVIVPLKDWEWSQQDTPSGRKPRREVARDGVMFHVPNPATPERPSPRMRYRILHFEGIPGFPEGVWVGYTGQFTLHDHGPPWMERSLMDISDEEFVHLSHIAKQQPHMTYAAKIEDDRLKQRQRAEIGRYGEFAAKAEQAGNLEKQIAVAVAAALQAERDKVETDKDNKRLAKERGERTSRETKGHRRETIKAAEAGEPVA